MVFLRLIPVIFSFLILAAHFSRIGLLPLMILSLLLAILLFVKRPWIARLPQGALVLGAIEWIRTIMMYVNIRQETGEDRTRLALILGIVALFTALSSLSFQRPSLKRRYQLGKTKA